MNGHTLEQGDTQDLEEFVEAVLEPELLLEDGHQHVHTDRGPDLGLHRIHGGAVERLDPQVLLDPLEEEFDLPPALVELGDLERREREVVRQEHEPPLRVEIDVGDAPQGRGVQHGRLGAAEHDGLVAAQPGGLVDRPRGAPHIGEPALPADHEVGQCLGDAASRPKSV